MPHLRERHLPRSDERVIAAFSDIEMGPGGQYDDFPHSAWLAELLLAYNRPPYDQVPVDLVFNGDTFDLLKTSWEGGYPHLITARIAVGKMRRIADAHPAFFRGLRSFLSHDGPPRRVHFVTGNHDAELVFVEVQDLIRERVGAPGVEFPGFFLDIGDAHFEHGQQQDPIFRVPEPGIKAAEGERVLDLSWGAIALLDVAMPLQHVLHHHDRIKPRAEIFRLLPELRSYLLGAFRQYFLQDFLGGWLSGTDPVKRVTWEMLRELYHRLTSGDTTITVADHFVEQIHASDQYRLIVFGHEHEAGLWTYGDRRVLRTGAFRNEYMLADDGKAQIPLPKIWAEVVLSDNAVRTSRLVEVDGPAAPEGYVPDSVFDVLERLPDPEVR